jgi:hypothetical protein
VKIPSYLTQCQGAEEPRARHCRREEPVKNHLLIAEDTALSHNSKAAHAREFFRFHRSRITHAAQTWGPASLQISYKVCNPDAR